MILSILDRQETWKARKMLPRELFWLTVVNINEEDIILKNFFFVKYAAPLKIHLLWRHSQNENESTVTVGAIAI